MNWSFLHNWYMPFIWITLASVVGVPVAMYFQNGMDLRPGGDVGLAYGSAWILRDDFLATIVVYLLNLGAAAWLFDFDGSTRWAAFWATLIGLGRIVSPIALATMADVSVAGNQHYVDWNTLRVLIWAQDFQFFLLGLMVWYAFSRFVGEGGPVASHFAHAEAH